MDLDSEENMRLKRYAFDFLESQLTEEQVSAKEDLLAIISNYIDNKLDYEQSLYAFNELEIQPDIVDRIKEIKSVDEIEIISTKEDSKFKRQKPWIRSEDTRLIAGIVH